MIEELLPGAAARAGEAIAAGFAEGYDPARQHAFSPEFERKIARLNRRADRSWFHRSMQRAASFFLALLVGSGARLTVDAEARETFVGWIEEPHDIMYAYYFSGEAETGPENMVFRPGWLPEGYTEYRVLDNETRDFIIYRNEDQKQIHFGYMYNVEGSAWYFDTSNSVRYESSVNGQPADLWLSTVEKTANVLVWISADETVVFEVTGFLPESELVRIAENIVAQKIKKKIFSSGVQNRLRSPY